MNLQLAACNMVGYICHAAGYMNHGWIHMPFGWLHAIWLDMCVNGKEGLV